MKVKTLKQFIDKNTKDLHKVNEELTISKERYQEINGTSLGIFVEEIRKEDTKEETKEELESEQKKQKSKK